MNELIRINDNYQVTYKVQGQEITLNFELVRQVLGLEKNITNEEIYGFIKLCEYRRLNPYLKEAYLTKFKNRIQYIVGIDVFTDRLNSFQQCKSWQAGVICINNNEIVRREGAFYLPDEKIVGGWFLCYKEQEEPFKWDISFSEYCRQFFKDGKWQIMSQWREMPGTMIVKCAIAAGARKALPSAFGGLYAAEEIGMENIIDITPDKEFKFISREDREKIYNAADSSVIKDRTKLINFVINKLVEANQLDISDINKIPKEKLNIVLTSINEIVKQTEKKVDERKKEEKKDTEKKVDERKKEEKKDTEKKVDERKKEEKKDTEKKVDERKKESGKKSEKNDKND
jgi:phage recombination protein Bet